MRSRHRLWLVSLAVLLVLSACAGGDVGEQDGDDAGQAEGGGEVTVAAIWTGKEQKSFEKVLQAFEEETGVAYSYNSTGDDVGAYLGTQIEGGSPPDVAMIPQPGLLRDLAEQGALQELGEDALNNMQEHFPEVWIELGSVDGTPYGVYFKAANKSTWWYNAPIFEQAGVQPPADWDEMLNTAETMTQFGLPWVSIGGADGWVLTDWFENIYLRTAGPEKYDQLAEHEIKWTDQSVIDALEIFKELLDNEDYIMGGRDGAVQTAFVDSAAAVFKSNPDAATVYEGDFVPGVVEAEAGAEEGSFDFFPFPEVEGSGAAVVGGGDAAVALSDNEAAQQLLAFLATPEAAEAWASEGGFTSPNRNLNTDVYPDEISQRSAEMIVEAGEAGNFRFDLSDLQPAEFGATTGQGLFKILQDFVKNLNAQQTAKQLEKAASQAFGG